MNTLLIFLDLAPLASILYRQNIVPYLQGTGTWAKFSDEVWLIKTTRNSVQVREDLRGILASALGGMPSQALVIDITKSPWASFNLTPEIVNWLNLNI